LEEIVMTMSAKWTTVSFFALSALAAGSFAFAGCTVTSGSPDDIEGGTGNPTPDSSTGDSSTGDGGTGDSSTAATCEGNKQTSGDFVNATCQAKLNEVCCAELKGCFNLEVDPDGGATDDCNKYAKCVDFARTQPTPQEQQAAQAECDLVSPKSVQDAYGAIEDCAVAKANAECQ
jgi:hypothetical protein